MNFSTIILREYFFACSNAAFASSNVLTLIEAPFPWFPSSGLKTNGKPTLSITVSTSDSSIIHIPLATGIAAS